MGSKAININVEVEVHGAPIMHQPPRSPGANHSRDSAADDGEYLFFPAALDPSKCRDASLTV